MKRLLHLFLTVAVLLLLVTPADAQFFKKLFKKKPKTEKKAKPAADGIDDALQVVMADVTGQTDNSNNRNGFLGIPLGIKADHFEQQLLAQGFVERKPTGNSTSKLYVYDGEVYGQPSQVTLYLSDQTERVFAVGAEETTAYPTAAAVQARYQELKRSLVGVYGKGYVDVCGEGYSIVTRLGTISVHFERGMMGGGYSIGFMVDDAKAYAKAYQEMADTEYEAVPRTIEDGLAPALHHTDVAGLALKLAQNRTVARAQTILQSYDYLLGKPTAKAITASMVIDDYSATVMLTRRKQAITQVLIVATESADEVQKDLKHYGFTTTDEKTFVQGPYAVVVGSDVQGRVTLRVK